MWPCDHDWKTAEKTVAAPRKGEIHGVTDETYARFLHGSVTVLRACILCGRQEKYEMIGQEQK